ncbi:MAG: hypothetical protein R3C17_03890 [Planctomycetaceae bacterium]
MTAVYRLVPNDHDPRFDGFNFPKVSPSCSGNAHARDDFKDIDGHKLCWVRRPLKHLWKPVRLEGAVRPFNDYPEIEFNLPVFSLRAVRALTDFLDANGELLPVDSDVGTYFIFNILTKSDAFIREESDADFSTVGVTEVALWVKRFVFRPEMLDDLSIFRIREYPHFNLVTQKFKDRAESAGLNGLCFVKLWPLPVGSDWMAEEARERREQIAAGLSAVDMQGQCLVVKLRSAGKKTTPAETAWAERIASDIERFLSQQKSVDDPYIGMVEDIRTLAKEIRIYLSGPSVDLLVDFLQPLLHTLRWPQKIELVRRYGNMLDRTAKECGDGVVSEGMTWKALDVPADIAAGLHRSIETGHAALGLSDLSSTEVVTRIDETVTRCQQDPDETAAEFPGMSISKTLGAVFGQQFVADCGWSWKWIDFRNSQSCFYELAVVPPDESLMLCPESSIKRLIEDPDHESNAALTFNLIRDGKLPASQPRLLSPIM